MRGKRVVVACAFIFALLLLVSSTSAFWPFTGKKESITTGYVISYSSAQMPICIGNELGAGGCDSGQHFSGQIDEITIYNRELSNSEVASVKSISGPTDGLVGYWNLDSSRTPALSGGAKVDVVTNYFDSVLTLDGVDDFASIAYSPELRPTEKLSFGLWFKPNDKTKSQRLISAIHEGGYGIVMNDVYGTCQSNTLCAIVRVGGSYVTAQVPVSSVTSTNEAALQGWTHVFATFNGSSIKLYLNGQQVVPPVPTNTTVNLGAECDARSDLIHTRICAFGLQCQDTNGDGIGACRSPAGQRCNSNSDCMSGYGLTCSSNGACMAPSTAANTTTVALGQECNMRDVPNKKICATDATCQDTNDDGVGACRHAAGQSCTQDSHCLSGVSNLKCVSNICTVQANIPSNSNVTRKNIGEICSSSIECANNNCFGNICTQFSSFEGDCDSTRNLQGAGIYGRSCQTGTGLSCVSTECICTGQYVWSPSQGRCVVYQMPSNYVTDISARGYVGENERTLVIGFRSENTADLTATIDASWTDPQALPYDRITTSLQSSTSGVTTSDSDPAAYAVKSNIVPAIYGLSASASGNGGQAVLATTGSSVVFSQFSARGYADFNTPLILGFTVKGNRLNLDIQAHPEKLPVEFSPKLTDLSYNITLYNASSHPMYTSRNTIGPQLSEGRYTVIVQPNNGAGGYMLLEVSDLNAAATNQASATAAANADIGAANANPNANVPGSTSTNTATGSSTQPNNTVQCTSGCLSANGQICHTEGFRSGSRYCDAASKSFVIQKATDAVCSNGFECSSNLCLDNKCVSQGVLQQLLRLLRNLFGNG